MARPSLFAARQSGRFDQPSVLLATAAWIAALPNAGTLGRFLSSHAAGDGWTAAAFAFGGWLFVLLVTYFALVACAIFALPRATKGVCGAFLIIAAALGYFSTFLGIEFDRNMVTNMAQTNVKEAVELVHWRMLAWLLAVGVLPAMVIARLPVRSHGRLGNAARSAVMLVALAVVTAVVVYLQYSRYASAARSRDITFGTVAPTNLLGAGISYGLQELKARTVRAPRGLDAQQAYAIAKPRLLVFVLGETARARNQGLNGYPRDTTPRMRAAGGVYFADTQSCGTATAISVPCIFSGLTRADFSLLRGRQNETLIDVVHRSGARVIWLDNDSGCKDVCSKAEYSDLTGSSDARHCPEPGECYDEVLLEGLEGRLQNETRDTLVVLHLKGSHGPAYYKRYPERFERFTPVCRSSDLSACDSAALVNTYDNTLLYTDHVVGETIAMLRRLAPSFAAALMYVSDHGESLGESGLYLHGLPYAIAPTEQTLVPMYAWIAPSFLRLERWDERCLARQALIPRSHDNVYATVLGFLDIDTKEYRSELDLFEACDPPNAASAVGKSNGHGLASRNRQ